jgi:phosphoadenosine phosphosulfate reductase
MLIPSHRHRADDLDVWAMRERMDLMQYRTRRMKGLVDAAKARLEAFCTDRAYIAISWGKDSVVVADIAARMGLGLPLYYYRQVPHANPDCDAVRDACMALWARPAYLEQSIAATPTDEGWWRPKWAERLVDVHAQFGERYISGIRGQESGIRRIVQARWGAMTERTCRPITDWREDDVFAYLAGRNLPVHPAYACSYGGMLERRALRVSTIGGDNGAGMGRTQWERDYYCDHVEAITQEWERQMGRRAGHAMVWWAD